jgi:hypothetical protein
MKPSSQPTELIVRYFAKSDVPPDESWRLVDWCAKNGADEFTINGMVAGSEGPKSAAFFASLAPYERSAAPRRRLSAPTAGEFVRSTQLWALSSETMALLRGAMVDGVFDYNAGGDPWLEDLALYRQGEFMMGVITHEDGGVLRISPAEVAELDRIGFPHRDEVSWIGY